MASHIIFPPTRGLFVTGTDTGVGKTLVAGAIARRLALAGWRVGVFKPIATGCRHEREGLVSSDAEFLAYCCDSLFTLEQINPIRYREPLAPLAAAERSQRPIDWPQVQEAYRYLAANCDVVIVEGIGGIMVPLTADYLVLDLMADLALPVVVVARNTLGTINHTLLTLAQCRGRNLHVSGVVLNRHCADTASLAQETNPRIIAEVGRTSVLTVIPCDKGSCVEQGQLGEETLAAAGLVDWATLLGELLP